MKKLIVLSALIVNIIFAYAQDESCIKLEESKKAINIKEEVAVRVAEIKYAKEVNDTTKTAIKLKYTSLQKNFNKVYGQVRDDIAGGYMFVGKGRLCKSKYFTELSKLNNQAQEFLEMINNADNKNKGYNNVFDWILKAIRFLQSVAEDILEPLAKERAEKFYNAVAWADYDALPPLTTLPK